VKSGKEGCLRGKRNNSPVKGTAVDCYAACMTALVILKGSARRACDISRDAT
jgi:hypothetical protein